MTEGAISPLLVRIASGDAAALSELSDLMGGPLRRLGTGYLGDASDGEDVAQETLARVWRAARRFDPAKGSARVWVYAIARNVARDMLRRRRIRWLVGLDSLPGEPEEGAPGPEAIASDRQELALVLRRMQDLPDAQRMALTLSAIEGLESRAIAEILGKSTGAVEQLLFRARKRLRSLMEEGRDG